jgi:hypothetical protein
MGDLGGKFALGQFQIAPHDDALFIILHSPTAASLYENP